MRQLYQSIVTTVLSNLPVGVGTNTIYIINQLWQFLWWMLLHYFNLRDTRARSNKSANAELDTQNRDYIT